MLSAKLVREGVRSTSDCLNALGIDVRVNSGRDVPLPTRLLRGNRRRNHHSRLRLSAHAMRFDGASLFDARILMMMMN